VRRATIDMQQGNARDASLAARSILEMKPSSAAAARVMAELAERLGERSALDWRRKVAQLDPHSVNDQLALARSALQFNDSAIAELALDAVEGDGKNTPPYHAACAQLAQLKRDNAKADAEWTEAIRLAPDDRSYQLQLALLRLRSSDANQRDWAEKTLAELRSDPAQRCAATRALIGAGVARHDDPRKLISLARELQSYPEATWNDRFLYLDFLHTLQDPQFSAYLTELE